LSYFRQNKPSKLFKLLKIMGSQVKNLTCRLDFRKHFFAYWLYDHKNLVFERIFLLQIPQVSVITTLDNVSA